MTSRIAALLALAALLMVAGSGCGEDEDHPVANAGPFFEPSDQATPAEPSLLFNVTCGGGGCGNNGTLVAQIKDCGFQEAPVHAQATMNPAMLLEDRTHSLQVPASLVGEFCARAWLDVDFDGELGVGDVFSSAGEVPVFLVGAPSAVGVRLDAIVY